MLAFDKPLLAGRRVLVVGVGAGLGRQVALAAARAGASVALSGRRIEVVDEVVGDVRATGGSAIGLLADPTVDEHWPAAIEATVAAFGGIDGVVYNAYHPGTMTVRAVDAPIAAWRAAFDVNLFGALRVVQAAIGELRRGVQPAVVLVGSQAARRVLPGRGDYATSKAALITLGQVLARELGGDGIRVNTVVPGRMMGPALAAHFERAAAAQGRTAADVQQDVVDLLALPAIATDAEVAGSVLYLLSELSAGVTGQTVDVNAGETFT